MRNADSGNDKFVGTKNPAHLHNPKLHLLFHRIEHPKAINYKGPDPFSGLSWVKKED